ncbi:DUF985 domain [Fusarium albosuccineum]|uniref:DUF985 domain n=1 Tax=Fusarium albosuccineum TaxID=1237068 RepID=A0A8H4L9P7_9HYPO|nr:DUF985 domain [Fusarium albosuccineum]
MGEFIQGGPDLGALQPSFTSSSKPETPRTASLIRSLALIPHMEGGYFVQTDEDPITIPSTYPSEALSAETAALAGPVREGFNVDTRRLSTTIFYLLTPRRPQGMFHRNRSRVIHTLHRGRGRYVLIHPGGHLETFVVGHAVERGERIQWVVEGNVWKASYLLPGKENFCETRDVESEGLLISETVVPGFEYCDHEFLTKQGIRQLLPEYQAHKLDWLVRQSETPENGSEPRNQTNGIKPSSKYRDAASDEHDIEPSAPESAAT